MQWGIYVAVYIQPLRQSGSGLWRGLQPFESLHICSNACNKPRTGTNRTETECSSVEGHNDPNGRPFYYPEPEPIIQTPTRDQKARPEIYPKLHVHTSQSSYHVVSCRAVPCCYPNIPINQSNCPMRRSSIFRYWCWRECCRPRAG